MRFLSSLPTLLILAATAFAAPEVDGFAVTVADLDRSVAFYTDVLGFEKRDEVEVADAEHERLFGVFGLRVRTARMALGEERLDLQQFVAPEGRPMPADSRGNDRWFQHIALAVRDMDAAYRHLRKHKVRHASSGPQRLPDWNPQAGGIEAFYFKDPDGHFLEAIRFPEGKGDPRWQRPSERLFLGIDHTAIVVADTDASIRFYKTLGLAPRGGSENHGTEQEHLNGVFGARLRITLLKGSHGPGIELLEYLAPSDGRPSPPDSRANDIWHWHVRLGGTIPPRANAVTIGGKRRAMVRDPDGHAIEITEES
ncbi:MAG: VOC family protein [Planctomycetes bacterium]|nr:VOC family protein [Planctomycetota bacterium]